MTTKSYCERAFNHLHSHARGMYKLCCHANPNVNIAKYTTKNTRPFDFFFSDEMEQIRNDMLEGKLIDGCEYCYRLEADGMKSPRLTNRLYSNIEPHSIGVQVRIFGSTCNLSCYMCFPFNSSTKNKEIQNIDTDIFVKHTADFYRVDDEATAVSAKDVLDNLEWIDHITIIGGEPFVMSSHWEFLDQIPKDMRAKISLRYQTNLTTLHHKKWHLLDYVDDFKSIKLFVSVDHIKDRLAWIRYPIDVDEFENNLMEYKQYIESMHTCVGILNVQDIPEIVRYYKDNFNLTVEMRNIVQYPPELSIKNLSDMDKVKVREILSGVDDVPDVVFHELSKPRVDSEYEKCIDYIKQLDAKRGTRCFFLDA